MKITESHLRKIIRFILEKKKLLSEPDLNKKDKENEASVSGSIAGVTVPLGAESTYPNKKKKKRKPPHKVAGRAFGNAKLAK